MTTKNRARGFLSPCMGTMRTQPFTERLYGASSSLRWDHTQPVEEFVHFFQLVAGVLGQDAHHRSDPVLAVVVLKEVENLLMVFVQIGNPFGFLHVLQPFRAPLIELEQEAVFINFEGFALKANFLSRFSIQNEIEKSDGITHHSTDPNAEPAESHRMCGGTSEALPYWRASITALWKWQVVVPLLLFIGQSAKPLPQTAFRNTIHPFQGRGRNRPDARARGPEA